MKRPFLRAVVSVGLLTGVSAGCASSGPKPVPREKDVLTAADIERQGATDEPLEKLLQGRIAGVSVSRAPDGGIAVRIRGATSLHGNSEPLYILDGFPIEPGSGGLITINPSDIAKIEILKDAGSTAAYGVRGANGVVVITSKR